MRVYTYGRAGELENVCEKKEVPRSRFVREFFQFDVDSITGSTIDRTKGYSVVANYSRKIISLRNGDVVKRKVEKSSVLLFFFFFFF